MRKIVSCAAAVVPLLLAQAAGADPIPTYVATAVADASRPETDRQRDADRRPADVVAFAGIKPGDKVADLMPGKGYFTRIFCKIVGDAGHVYAISVPRNAPSGSTAGSTPSGTPAAQPLSEACTNITVDTLRVQKRPAPELWSSSDDPGEVYEYWSFSPAAEAFAAPAPLDVIWTAENYHDLHNKSFGSPNMLLVGKALLKALKPGGVLMIEDHAAANGSGARDSETLHRIDAAQVTKEMLAAGFIFVAESKLLRNTGDPHTVKAHEMHDRTDRFLLKFRKP